MAVFEMCPDCRREYEDPLDRRFHAQPVACPACGPRLWLAAPSGAALEPAPADPVAEARARLLRGEIVAIKGVGGFHLAAVASDEAAVATLRRRKGRDGTDRGKPFAVMARDLDQAREVAEVGPAEAALLASVARPIVLLERRGGAAVAASVAPGLGSLGVMLPYSPLHHLLLERPMPPLVMTSGNPAAEPITTGNDEAVRRLGPLSDALLLHDREICSGVDDSVAQVVGGRPLLLRRARGYVPRPILAERLPVAGGVLALGGEMKGAICLTRPGQLVLGRHLGELDHVATQDHLRAEVALMTGLLGVTPRVVAHDLHPDYFTSRLARELAGAAGAELERIAVQHHHAHLASCLAEHDVPPDQPVLGVVFDGTGYGPDGTIWGGELLVGSYGWYRRAARLRPIALPGGDAAIRSPFRAAVALLLDALGDEALDLDLPLLSRRPRPLLEDLRRMIAAGIASPRSSGMGRLFDAIAAVVGLPGGLADPIAYEAQPAMELEAAAAEARDQVACGVEYPFELVDRDGAIELDCRPLVRAVVAEVRDGVEAPLVAARFHGAVIRMAATAAGRVAGAEGLRTVALSGGCFNNRLLLEGLSRRLESEGMTVLRHELAPCGDGGLALGQAAVAGVVAAVEKGSR
jgi:hydrogenase maturation protein HypF